MERMEKYQNRQEAGDKLAKALSFYTNQENVMVLALPRGGVPVAYEIAKQLHAPLDVFIVRKLGVPGHAELAMGAIASGDVIVFNDNIIKDLMVSKSAIDNVFEAERKELQRREKAYRGNHPFPILKDKIVILVDDGIATGATMRAAIYAMRKLNAKRLIVAVPVADNEMCHELSLLVDELICPMRPTHFYAVGAWYQDFSQTEDKEVYQLLNQARKR